MADSIRKRIMANVGTRLATITTANGYRTNIGNNVFEWKTNEWDTDEMMGVAYMDTSNAPEYLKMSSTGGVFNNTLNVELTIATQIGSGGTTNALVMASVRDAIADIYDAIRTDTTWGGLALWTLPSGDDMGVDQENRTQAGANVKIAIVYRTKAFEPDTIG